MWELPYRFNVLSTKELYNKRNNCDLNIIDCYDPLLRIHIELLLFLQICFCFERDGMLSLSDNNQADVIDVFTLL